MLAGGLIPCRHAHHAQKNRLGDRPCDDACPEGGLVEEAVRLVMDELKVKVYQVDGLFAGTS